ncbi:MAG: mechanosensitive ion channel domain-containing protein [Planctomycetota bacterium]
MRQRWYQSIGMREIVAFGCLLVCGWAPAQDRAIPGETSTLEATPVTPPVVNPDKWPVAVRVEEWLRSAGVPEGWVVAAATVIWVVAILILAVLADLIARRIILGLLRRFASKTETVWDDILLDRKVFAKLSRFAPALVVYAMVPLVFPQFENLAQFVKNVAQIYMLVTLVLVAFALLDSILDIYRRYDVSKRLPIKGFLQAVKIVAVFVGGILALSLITDKSPNFFLGGLGAMTAVLMLIFKDAILGFVAGIQLSSNDMVRPGDWIEMPAFGADGDVVDVSLTTIKIQNWDKTISTIPTYALITSSFKNWRGMTDGDGRRIKRSVHVDMASVRFCDEEMLARFRKIQLLQEYLADKQAEVQEHNKEHNVDDASLVNGRRLTNLGTFRAYVAAYLQAKKEIHKGMTFLVRQLAPTTEGVPIEMYVFSADKNWVNYEGIQSDIFDHLLAVVPEFDLRVFQKPTGADLQGVIANDA